MAKCNASYGLGFACFALAVAMASAAQFTVGGANGWSVPPAGAESLNAWAMKNRFQVGDKLLFVYPSDQDSVLLVEPSEYNTCNTSSYDKKFTDGSTVFTLDRSGAFFIISGVEANCRANEKLIVMVLAAAGRNGTAPAPSTTPPSSTSPPPAASTAPPPPSSPSVPPPASPSPPPPSSPAPTTASPSPPAPAPTRPANTTPPAASSSPPATPPPSAPPPPPASSPAPGTQGNGTTTTGTKPSPAGSNNHHNGAGMSVSAGLVSSVGAFIVGFAMLAL